LNDLLVDWLLLMSEVVDRRCDPGMVADVGRSLLRRWSEPHRRYHDVEHLAAILSIVDELGAPAAVRLAGWYHDAVYDPRAADNEERSARLAIEALSALRAEPGLVDEVARLVRLTASHDPGPEDAYGQLLCDADLAVLARPWDEYQRYAAAVREEYRRLSDEDFRAGRAAVLRHLRDLPVLFHTPELRDRWEKQARANLDRELDALS
jgi:predicted metal-dependent HD superfamily phosphohydrolase